MSSPALQVHLDPAGKVLDDTPAFLPWDRSYCCCDCCLQVRDSLVFVAIHPVINLSPRIKIWGFKSGECGDHCGSHLQLISRSGKRCCSYANDSFEVWGWHHLVGNTGRPWRPLCVDQVLSRTFQAPGHIARCWLSQTARCRPRAVDNSLWQQQRCVVSLMISVVQSVIVC